MAEALNMNMLQFLRKVIVTDDMRNQDNNQPMSSTAVRTCLELAAQKIGFEQKWHAPGQRTLADGRLHGIAIDAINDRHGGASGDRGVVIYMNNDGTANFVTGQSNNMMGANTVTPALIIAETLGLPASRVTCSSYGTADQAPDGGMQAGSTGAISNGLAAQAAALDVREQMFTYAANQLGVAIDDLHAGNGSIFSKSDPTKTITHAVVMAKISKPIVGVGKNPGTRLRRPHQGGTVGQTAFFRSGVASAVEVAVDPETGDVEILNHVHIYDAGRIMDPHACEGQVSSSLWSQAGKALLWDIHHDPQRGALLDQTHVDMKAHTSMDINDDVHGGELIETINYVGPFGMQGLGEPAAHGTGAAAIMGAIHNAIGGSYQSMQRPMTPDKILKHLGKA